MSRALPKGWCWAPALDLCEAIPSGATPPAHEMTAEEGDVPFLKVYNLTFDGSLDFSNKPTFVSRETHEGRLKRSQTYPGDVLMNIVGPPLGKVSVVPDAYPEWNFNQAMVAFKTLPSIASNWYLAAFLRSPELLEWTGFSSKATVGQFNLSVTSCRALPVPLAPLNEQKRIVAKIDALTEKSREAREALDEVPELLDKLRQSILAAAFRGDLTKKWREQNPNVEPASALLERIRQERRQKWEEAELAKMKAKGKPPQDDKWKAKYTEPEPVDTEGLPELPEGWCWASVDEVSVLHQYGSSSKTTDSPEVPVLRMGNIVDGQLDFDNLKYLPAQHEEFPDLFLQPGDMLFNRTNSPELVGKSAVFRGAEGKHPTPCSYASYLICVRTNGLQSELLAQYINSPAGRSWIYSQVSQQVGQANVNGTKLKSLCVPLPPQAEQLAMLEMVEQSLRTLPRLTAVQESAVEEHERLDASILAKAFRGELVPQDPSDEPASVLLERIQAERQSATPKKKARKKKAKKS